MNVILYNFSKRPNSTKEPNPMDATRKEIPDVQLKNECSFLSPTLILSQSALGSGFSPVKYNYVTIPYWQRHYFVKDWRWVNPYWEVDLTVDALASFKYAIGETEAYILRSSAVYDGNIIDNFYPAKTNPFLSRISVACSWYGVAPSGGCYVVGIINYQTSNRVGAISYYALTPAQLGSVLRFLFSDQIYNNELVSGVDEGLFKAMFNPFQYIVSCMWFPFATSSFGSTTTDIKCGYWSTGVNGVMVSALAQKTYVTANIPGHPQAARGAFLDHAPYTRMTLYLPPFGAIPIDTSTLSNGYYLYSPVMIDHITGQATIRISTCEPDSLDETHVVTERSGQLGVPIQLAQVLTDNFHTATSIGGAIGAALTGNIFGAISGVSSAIESQMPQVSTSGANGSFVAFIQQPVLIIERTMLVNENKEEFGKPIYQNFKINTIPGYILCGEADHDFACTDVESQMINNALKTGFFYE